MTGISLKTSIDCLVGKLHRFSFHKSHRSRRSHVLDLMHTNVCSITDRSLGGALYFVTFIDDHSWKRWTYCLKSKNLVLNVFKCFHVLVERQVVKKLKCIRTDNGIEYCGPFEHYSQEHGIRLKKTVPKIPQWNGVVEKITRTIEEHIRCMLSNAKLPISFWGEALLTTVDLINLSP